MIRLRFLAAPLALLALLGGCETLSPEAKVRQRLIEAGLKPRLAQCMAERMADRLSLGQLNALARAAKVPTKDIGHMTVNELTDRLRAVGDPEIVTTVTRAGIGCVIAG